MPSPIYELFHQAMAERKQIVCMYGSFRRELCPIILGHSQSQEKALTYQFGGQSESGLPPDGEWRCLCFARDRGMPVPATGNRKAALKSSISM